MSQFSDRVFVNPTKLLKDTTQVVFVADLFVEDYVGGAELTSEALIEESPFTVQKIRCKDLNVATLSQGVDKFWIFGNFSQMDAGLIPTIVANLKYAVLEYDYKYCKLRSPEKHRELLGEDCDCHNQINGKLISSFYYGASSLWWMSEAQKERYLRLFPFLSDKDNVVLSSVFTKNTLGTIRWLREHVAKTSVERKGWVVLGSQSWVKGFEQAKKWCEDEKKDYEIVWNLPYEEVLAKLSQAEGFVYLPSGGDTCPRMVIEAKLLGCSLHLNDNVQHAKESWFDTTDLESVHDYLYSAPSLFWTGIRTIMDYRPKISGYTTTYNCVSQGYPFEQSIMSMLQFCDEVCVVDGGSTDETLLRLFNLARDVAEPGEFSQEFIDDVTSCESSKIKSFETKRLKVKRIDRDWSHPRFAVFDGMQKAEARKMCSGDFCWQMDSDEIVHEEDVERIIEMCAKMPGAVDIVSLPVVEYWGGYDKVRCDIQPWKWRLSRNKPYITHDIPVELRRVDSTGDTYAAEGTDGCDMIHLETGVRLPHITFHNEEAEKARLAGIAGDAVSLSAYQNWFNNVIENLPSVYHYSWYDMSRKIKTYKHYWTKHWNSLYNKSIEDTAENNMFFDLPWSQVTDEMIQTRSEEIRSGTGGWIWHKKWKGQNIPHITINKKPPSIAASKL